MAQVSKMFFWSGIILILIIGIIHVIDAPDSFHDAAYKGWLFYGNGAAALVSAVGIFRRHAWGWYWGLMIAVGAFMGYVASRTVGLPFIPAEPEAWLEPLGITSLIAEVLFVAVFLAGVPSRKKTGL
ncbi:MAG: hypothetical protein HQL16_02090 [Candidatus Omnitrophica bacterium]|nr:hypothetical protein [Candidatus Omnitrophota bacterium]